MPYFSDEPDRQRDRGRGGFASAPPDQFPEDTELREYSDDMDMSGLGELLGGEPFSFGEPTDGELQGDWRDGFVPPPEPPMPEPMPESRQSVGGKISALLTSLRERLPRGKKKKNDLPQNDDDGSGLDFQYNAYGDISDNGTDSLFDDSFAQTEEANGDWQDNSYNSDEPYFDDTFIPTEETSDGEPFSAITQPPEKSSLPARAAAFFTSLGGKITGFFSGLSGKKKPTPTVDTVPEMPDDPNFISDTVSFVDAQEEESGDNWSDGFSQENGNWNQSDIPQGTYAPYQEDFPQEFTDEGEPDAVSASDGDGTADQPESAAPEKTRDYGFMAGVRRRIAAFRRRLPSFRPKVYTIPEPVYEPEEDNIKSPTLAADIERYIAQEQDLGEVQREFERMQGFIRGVNTDVGLRHGDVPPPPQMQDVRAAENELFDLIASIDRQNEEQRGRIGVYEEPPEQDPYNYRGINDARQYYTDIEATTFSLQPSVSFESERRVNPERRAAEQAYNDELRRHLEGDPINRLGGQTFAPAQSEPPAREKPVGREPSEPFEDGFELRRSRAEASADAGRNGEVSSRFAPRTRREEVQTLPPTPTRSFHRRSEGVRENPPLSSTDSELANDFDSQFHPSRTSPRSSKTVKVRRRG